MENTNIKITEIETPKGIVVDEMSMLQIYYALRRASDIQKMLFDQYHDNKTMADMYLDDFNKTGQLLMQIAKLRKDYKK